MQEPTKPTFAEVARTIAKGKPDDWLAKGLEHFSKFVRATPELKSKEYKEIDERMLEAARYLTKHLPIYSDLEKEFGFECPDCVDNASNALHELIELLEKDINESRWKPKSNIQQRICASVVIEAWRLIHHRKVEHRSRPLGVACIDYWSACGRELTDEINEPENWRVPIEDALDEGAWVREVLERYKIGAK